MKPFLSFFLLVAVACSPGNKEANSLPEIYNLGSRIDYEVVGEGDTTLLFVHGWCINKGYWEEQVEHFSKHYKVVTMDLPGHGKSDKNRTDWSIQNFGNDVQMVMEALSLQNVVLIGHSMGGNIILEAALGKPDAVIGFVGVDNFKDLGIVYSIEEKAETANFLLMMRNDYKHVVSDFAQGMLFDETTNKNVVSQVMDDILNTPPEISVSIIESLENVNDHEGAQMKRLKVKLHLINSDGMPTNEDQLRKYCTNSFEVHSIGNVGHYPMVEVPEKFNEILDDILVNY